MMHCYCWQHRPDTTAIGLHGRSHRVEQNVRSTSNGAETTSRRPSMGARLLCAIRYNTKTYRGGLITETVSQDAYFMLGEQTSRQ